MRKIRRDQNHLEILHDLRALGYWVEDMARAGNSFPDLIVADRRKTVIVEVKTPEGSIYLDQIEWIANWPNYAGFARNVDEAIRLMTNPETCLSDEEKEKMLAICLRYRAKTKDKRPRISVAKFEKEMAR